MKLSTGQKIAAEVALAILLQVVMGISAYRSLVSFMEATVARRAAFNGLVAGTHFLSVLKDADRGQRGFLITENPAALRPYESAQKNLQPALTEFLNFEGEAYPQECARILELTTQVMEEMAETVRLTQHSEGGSDAAQELMRNQIGQDEVDEIQGLMDPILDALHRRKIELSERTVTLSSAAFERLLMFAGLTFAIILLAGLSLARDFQRRLESETELAKQRSLLRTILDSMADSVLVAQPNGNFELFNAAAHQLHPEFPHDANLFAIPSNLGLFELDRVTPVNHADLPLARALHGERVDLFELYHRAPGMDQGRYLGVTGRPILNQKEEVTGAVIVVRDITLQKESEIEVRQAKDELELRVRQRTAELASTNEELLQKNRENEMFVYSVSHDLRTPLVNLQGFSKELEFACGDLHKLCDQANLPPEIAKQVLRIFESDIHGSLHFIRTAVLRLASIIDSLLRLSRAGRVEYQWEVVDVQALVQRIVDSQQMEISNKEIELELGELPPAWGDFNAIERVFSNLIDNAIKYLDPERPGKIQIGAFPPSADADERTTYWIRDNGLGIPPNGYAKLFKAFERLHPQVSSGEGVGLAIVERSVKRLNGALSFESQVGKGTTFYVRLMQPTTSGTAIPSEAIPVS